MKQWSDAGYFGRNLLVRKGYNGKFKKISAMGNDPWEIKKDVQHGSSKVHDHGEFVQEGASVQSGAAKGVWGHVKLRKTGPRKKKAFKRAKLQGVRLRKAEAENKAIGRFALDNARLRHVEDEMMEILDDSAKYGQVRTPMSSGARSRRGGAPPRCTPARNRWEPIHARAHGVTARSPPRPARPAAPNLRVATVRCARFRSNPAEQDGRGRHPFPAPIRPRTPCPARPALRTSPHEHEPPVSDPHS